MCSLTIECVYYRQYAYGHWVECDTRVPEEEHHTRSRLERAGPGREGADVGDGGADVGRRRLVLDLLRRDSAAQPLSAEGGGERVAGRRVMDEGEWERETERLCGRASSVNSQPQF